MSAKSNMVLSVILIEGAGIPKADLIGESDPYCVLSIKGSGESQKSKYIDNNPNPVWNDSFTFFIKDLNQVLHIDLYDKDIFPKPDDLLAQTDIELNTLNEGQNEGWFNLTCVKKNKGNPKIRLQIEINNGKHKF